MLIENPDVKELQMLAGEIVLVITKNGKTAKGKCSCPHPWRGIQVDKKNFWASEIASIETVEETKSP